MYNKLVTGDIGGTGYNFTEPDKIHFFVNVI